MGQPLRFQRPFQRRRHSLQWGPCANITLLPHFSHILLVRILDTGRPPLLLVFLLVRSAMPISSLFPYPVFLLASRPPRRLLLSLRCHFFLWPCSSAAARQALARCQLDMKWIVFIVDPPVLPGGTVRQAVTIAAPGRAGALRRDIRLIVGSNRSKLCAAPPCLGLQRRAAARPGDATSRPDRPGNR